MKGKDQIRQKQTEFNLVTKEDDREGRRLERIRKNKQFKRKIGK